MELHIFSDVFIGMGKNKAKLSNSCVKTAFFGKKSVEKPGYSLFKKFKQDCKKYHSEGESCTQAILVFL